MGGGSLPPSHPRQDIDFPSGLSDSGQIAATRSHLSRRCFRYATTTAERAQYGGRGGVCMSVCCLSHPFSLFPPFPLFPVLLLLLTPL